MFLMVFEEGAGGTKFPRASVVTLLVVIETAISNTTTKISQITAIKQELQAAPLCDGTVAPVKRLAHFDNVFCF